MADSNTDDTLSSEEGKKRAESLFSKNFKEYLISKKSSKPSVADLSSGRNRENKPSSLTRDYSASSCDTSASESSRKSNKKGRKKTTDRQSRWDFHRSFRNRLTQCSLLKTDEEVVPPEDLKPLLVNMTILLQDLKQSPAGCENLYNLISKITILVTEFIRRPLKKIQEDDKGEYSKKIEKTIEAMLTLLQEYKDGPNLDPGNCIREYKRIEREISQKDMLIAEAKQKLSGDAQKNNHKIKDLDYRVRSSILANDKLKSDIKFNHSHVKKYKRILLEKEWAKHKLETELNNLKKKISKIDLCDGELQDRMPGTSELSLRAESSPSSSLSKTKSTKMKRGKENPKFAVKSK